MKWLQILLVLLMALLLAGCQPPTIAEVEEFDVIQLQHGDILPMLPREVNVTFTNGRQGKLAISWDVLEGHEGSAQVWEDMTIKGYIKSGLGQYAVMQLIEVTPLENPNIPVEGEIIPSFPSGPVVPKDKRDPMENLAMLEVNWSGTDISLELKEELRALLYRAQWITRGTRFFKIIRVDSDQEVLINGRVFFLADDPYFHTYKNFREFLEATYIDEHVEYIIFHEYCAEVNGLLYYWKPHNLEVPYEIKDPWQMHVVEMTADRIIVELTQIIIYPIYGAFEDVSTMEFLRINGEWRIAKQNFIV